MKLFIFSILCLAIIFPVPAYAETIKNQFFEIEIPNRFTHIEGGVHEAEGMYAGSTKGTNPWANEVVAEGAHFVMEFSIMQSLEEFLNVVEEYDEDIGPQAIDSGLLEYENSKKTKSYYRVVEMISEDRTTAHIHSYHIFQKESGLAVFLMYFDTNGLKAGRLAVNDMYHQIKASNEKLQVSKQKIDNDSTKKLLNGKQQPYKKMVRGNGYYDCNIGCVRLFYT